MVANVHVTLVFAYHSNSRDESKTVAFNPVTLCRCCTIIRSKVYLDFIFCLLFSAVIST